MATEAEYAPTSSCVHVHVDGPVDIHVQVEAWQHGACYGRSAALYLEVNMALPGPLCYVHSLHMCCQVCYSSTLTNRLPEHDGLASGGSLISAMDLQACTFLLTQACAMADLRLMGRCTSEVEAAARAIDTSLLVSMKALEVG